MRLDGDLVMRREVTMDHFRPDVVVVIRAEMDVLRRQEGQAENAQHAHRGQHTPHGQGSHLRQYIGRDTTGPPEEIFRKTSGRSANRRG